MISLRFHDKQSIRIRAAQALDNETKQPVDEYRITIWEEVVPYAGLPESVRHTFTRAQLLALRHVITDTIGAAP